MRRKGEKPIVTPPEAWSENHPVAKAIRERDRWMDAWLRHCTTPVAIIERKAKISNARVWELIYGADPTAEEIERLATLWKQTPEALAASITFASTVTNPLPSEK